MWLERAKTVLIVITVVGVPVLAVWGMAYLHENRDCQEHVIGTEAFAPHTCDHDRHRLVHEHGTWLCRCE